MHRQAIRVLMSKFGDFQYIENQLLSLSRLLTHKFASFDFIVLRCRFTPVYLFILMYVTTNATLC